MLKELSNIIPEERIRSRFIDRVSFASDAGFYYLVPKAIVQPESEQEIIALFQFSHKHKIPLVFRTGGTSLSGQSITDGILVDLSQFWNRIKVESNGTQVRVQPGITGAMVNAYLKKFGRKIGPDPSSINAAMMGGILSNNASGMCCGVAMNSYHTTKFIRFILPNGNIYSTEYSEDYTRFEKENEDLFNGLRDTRMQILQDQHLFGKIRKKYRTKTTVGYSLNAFLDFEHPLDILAHLLVGAEGTLAFISEAVMNTVPDHPFKSTALLFFTDIYAACKAIVPLTNAGAMMVELMDRASLHAVEDLQGMPSIVKTLPETASALLIEFQEENLSLLEDRVNQFLENAADFSLINAPVFTNDPEEQAFLWKVRKGLFPAVGAVRASGTTVILEDIAFPVEKLGDAILDLQDLFRKYEYYNAIIFGHAKDGNIHFVITQSFNTSTEIHRYEQFMNEVVALVVKKYDGTLKAEHGTGRNMAPFVETEWGSDAYDIIVKIKDLVDPLRLLNPGVIVNDDKSVHIKDLKQLPTVEEEVDRCIECGYCEHVCPSRDLTTTPRRRIVIRRVLQQLKDKGDYRSYRLLRHEFEYDGIETCAVDGLCATACPVDINTGDLVKRLRNEEHNALENKLANFVAKNFGLVQNFARTGIGVLNSGAKIFFPSSPLYDRIGKAPSLQALKQIPAGKGESKIVYYPSCITRMMGTYEGKSKNLLETFLSVCEKSGIDVIIPKDVSNTCCSQIFSSKGYNKAWSIMGNKVIEQLWHASEEGMIPIVTDVSSCAYSLQKIKPVLKDQNRSRFESMTFLDCIDMLHDMVLPFTEIKMKKDSIALHSVCSLKKMHNESKFVRIAKHFSKQTFIPVHSGCCGMAGDRGFLFPELTASATSHESTEYIDKEFEAYYSSTRTCELAMSQAIGKNFESILYLADECL